MLDVTGREIKPKNTVALFVKSKYGGMYREAYVYETVSTEFSSYVKVNVKTPWNSHGYRTRWYDSKRIVVLPTPTAQVMTNA